MIVLDTDIFIDLLRGFKEAEIFFTRNAGEIVFSAISEGELLSGSGCNDFREKERVLHLLSQFKKIPVDNPLIQLAADIRRCNGAELPDAIIAASALESSSVLITRNLDDFKNIEGLVVKRPY